MNLSKLQIQVINQLGYDELDEDCKGNLSDISNHGVDGGFTGFIYYTDTVKFFDDNREVILTELNELADELGESAVDMVKNFGCLSGDYNHEVDQVLMGLTCEDDTTVKNALAWFAAEHVAFQLNED